MTDNIIPRTYRDLPDVQVFDNLIENQQRGRVTVIPRPLVRDIGKRRVGGAKNVHKTLTKPGLYIIWGFTDTREQPTIYIGYADNCQRRLKGHDKAPPCSWTHAAVLTANNRLNGKKHRKRRRWLESMLLDLALKREGEGAWTVANRNRAKRPDLTVPSERILREMFNGLLVCLPHVGLYREENHMTRTRPKIQAPQVGPV